MQSTNQLVYENCYTSCYLVTSVSVFQHILHLQKVPPCLI